MPDYEILPTPEIAVTMVRGFPQPPNIRHINIETGTGFIVATVEEYPYPVYLFNSPTPISVDSVEELVIHLQPYSSDEPEEFDVFVWNLTNGAWDLLDTGWGSMPVEDPGRYVDNNGDVYLAIRTEHGGVIQIENFWLTCELNQTDGTKTTLGKNE